MADEKNTPPEAVVMLSLVLKKLADIEIQLNSINDRIKQSVVFDIEVQPDQDEDLGPH